MSVHQWFRTLFALSLMWAAFTPGAWARGDDAQPPTSPGVVAPGSSITKALDDAWPDRPEWLDMYTDILQGSQLGPNDGWFRRAVAQTRFGWEATRAALRPRRRRPDRPRRVPRPRRRLRPARPRPRPGPDRGRLRLLAARADPLARRHAVLPRRPRRQRQGHPRGARRLLQAGRQRRPGLPLARRPPGRLPHASASPPAAVRRAGAGRRRRPWSAACSARRSARSSRGPRWARRPPTSPSRPSTARRRSRSRSSSGRSRSSWSSATSPAGRSAARPGTSRSSTAATRTGRRS